MPVLERPELEASPLADLHAIADQLGLDGFRRLRKAKLIDAILDESGQGAAAPDSAPADAGEEAVSGRDGAEALRRDREAALDHRRHGPGRFHGRDADAHPAPASRLRDERDDAGKADHQRIGLENVLRAAGRAEPRQPCAA